LIELLYLALLAIVQGITEFLPISSSAHLILVPALLGVEDQGLGIDVALHAGTLAAVMLYFRTETAQLFRGGIQILQPGARSEDRTLALQVAVATLPVVFCGLLLKDYIAQDFRSVPLIATTTIIFGLLLGLADWRGRGNAEAVRITMTMAVIVGLAQALALVPGVSRSGITMTAALLVGLARPDAARFALLLAIPTTAAAGLLGGWEIARGSEGFEAPLFNAVVAAVFAFGAAYLAIAWLMRFLRKATFMPFVWYRVGLGLFLLVWWFVLPGTAPEELPVDPPTVELSLSIPTPESGEAT
jgi:undecaprenyl-diphosphatase